MPMTILFITPYPFDQAPSQRFRFEQYFEVLKRNDWEISQESFLDSKTWAIFYKKGMLLSKLWGIAKGIIRRHLLFFKLHRYDLIFIHREACFIGPPYFEWIYANVFKKKIIFDFDDAIWLRDVSEANSRLSFLKRSEKTAKIIKYSSFIIAGNDYLGDYARLYNNHVTIIPTTIDTNYHRSGNNTSSRIRIGWTGSITTNKHFEMLIPLLKKLNEHYGDKIEFITISNKPTANGGLPINYIKWNRDSEIKDLQKIDIGIMPLPDDEWAKGKCGFKGLQYMALEIPTIMSPVGVNTEIIQDGINGYLATTEQEWFDKLSLLIESKELREKIGKSGRTTVQDKYSVEANKQKYLQLFNQLISR